MKKEDSIHEEEMNSNGKIKIIASIAGMIVLALLLIIFFVINKKSQKETDLQDKIVSSALDEEKEEVLSVDDKDETESSIIPVEENENTDKIISRTENEKTEIEVKEIPSPSPEKPIMETDVKDYSKVKYDIKSNLSEMENYFNENNLDALSDLAHLDRFLAMSFALRDTSDFAYYGDTNDKGEPDGRGIAVYADNEYYCGEWSNGVREGSGVWLHYHIHLKENLTDAITFHEYIGNFHNDLPEGEGQDHYEFDPLLMVKDKVYLNNYIGNYTAGYIDGDFYVTGITKNDQHPDYTGSASMGSFIYISESRDKNNRGPVLTETQNPDSYYWISEEENRNIGVSSYISKNR